MYVQGTVQLCNIIDIMGTKRKMPFGLALLLFYVHLEIVLFAFFVVAVICFDMIRSLVAESEEEE